MAKKKTNKISAKKRKLINLKISFTARKKSIQKKIGKVNNNDKLTTGQKRTAVNELLNEGVQLNTALYDVQEKLNKVVKKPIIEELRNVPKDENKLNIVLGKVWEKSNVEDYVFDELNKLNSISINKDADKALDLLNRAYQIMGSDDYIMISIDNKGNGILSVINGNDLNDDEFDYL